MKKKEGEKRRKKIGAIKMCFQGDQAKSYFDITLQYRRTACSFN